MPVWRHGLQCRCPLVSEEGLDLLQPQSEASVSHCCGCLETNGGPMQEQGAPLPAGQSLRLFTSSLLKSLNCVDQ